MEQSSWEAVGFDITVLIFFFSYHSLQRKRTGKRPERKREKSKSYSAAAWLSLIPVH